MLKWFEEYDKYIRMKNLSDYPVYYQRFIGNYIELKEHWIRFREENIDKVNANTIFIECSFLIQMLLCMKSACAIFV